MRRISLGCVSGLGVAACAVPLLRGRTIYTTWVTIPSEKWAKKESWLKRITSQSNYRSFEFWHTPVAEKPANLNLSSVELYLLSCIENDTARLLHLSWGYDFDSFWQDRVKSHDRLFGILYRDGFSIHKYILGNCVDKEEEKMYLEKKLNYLKSVLNCANKTQQCFTAITKTRFHLQRYVWNALERERYLCACVEMVESFRKEVPEEFREKAMAEIDAALVIMRHWVNDCPNAKRTFTRRLA